MTKCQYKNVQREEVADILEIHFDAEVNMRSVENLFERAVTTCLQAHDQKHIWLNLDSRFLPANHRVIIDLSTNAGKFLGGVFLHSLINRVGEDNFMGFIFKNGKSMVL